MKFQKNDLINGGILNGFILFSLPIFLGSLFQQLYGTVDLMFVGNYCGKNDAAAVGASSILVVCLIGLFTGISVGTGVIVARYFGAEDRDNIKKCIQNALLLGTIGGVLLIVVGLLISEQVLLWLNTPENIMDQALVYIRIYMLSMLPMIFYNLSSGILRAIGDSKTPFYILAVGGILNVCMDALFVAVLEWGVEGAALATVVSQTFTAVTATGILVHRERITRVKWMIEFPLIINILKVGFPLGIQSTMITLSNMIVQYHINDFGEDAIAAFAIYFKAENFIYMPIMAFGQAMVTFTGQNAGAKKHNRICSGAVKCNLFSAIVTVAISTIVLIFGRTILGMFCDDEAVIQEGLKIIHISFPLYFLYSILEVSGGIVKGMGKTLQSMAIIIVNLCVIRIILLGIMDYTIHTIEAVTIVYPLTWALAAVTFIIYTVYLLRKNKMISLKEVHDSKAMDDNENFIP